MLIFRGVMAILLPITVLLPAVHWTCRLTNTGRFMMSRLISLVLAVSFLAFMALPAAAVPFVFNTGNPDGLIATASRPPGAFEIESADDFIVPATATLTSATFTGLLTGGATISDIGNVVVEIYRVFPKDSDVGRTSGPPTFSTPLVPTRVNSPSDVALADRDTASATLTFSTMLLNPTFTAINSVQPGGIHPKPGQTTGGDGAITGQEVKFDVNFVTPLVLPSDHYFFIPQVEVAGGEFLWLSAPRPIVPPGTPFPAGSTDLQSWTRDAGLDPDWLRVGTDIVGGSPAPTFNAAFSLTGAVPLPGSLPLLGTGLAGLLMWRRMKSKA
jgi:hypothetical protein